MITATPQVRGSAYMLFVDYLEKAGNPLRKTLPGDLLPAIIDRNPEALVPVHLAHLFIGSGARTVGAADFGFVVARDARIAHLGAFGRAIARSLTLNEALGKIRSNLRFYSSAERVWWVRRGAEVHVHHAYTYPAVDGSQHAQQAVLILMRDLVRLAAGPDWQPETVLCGPGIDAAGSDRTFAGARRLACDHPGIVFPAALLSRPLGGAQARHRNDPDVSVFEANAPAADIVGSIRQVVTTLMAHGAVRLPDVATAVGVEPRTLQRRLAETEIDFSEIVAGARFELALTLLNDPAQRVIDIAYELGYADPANFTRAFRKWTGLSPAQYRRDRDAGAQP